MNTRTMLLLASAILALAVIVHHGLSPRASSAAAPANPVKPVNAPDANAPVVRFVKNPETAPLIDAQDLAGHPVDESTWAGKVVLVNFWATWCPPCREEIPELIQLVNEYKGRLQIVGISEDDDPPAKVAQFAREKGMTYPIVMATDKLIGEYGGVPALPTTFVVDPQGRVVQKHAGLYPIESYRLEINTLLGAENNVKVETFADTGQIFLKNAANATELPGVSFKGVTPEQKKQALRRMNAENCTCGCGLTISQCRVNDTECPVSGNLAADIIKQVARGPRPARPRIPVTSQPEKGTSTISE